MVNVALLICTLVKSFIIYEMFDGRLEILQKKKKNKQKKVAEGKEPITMSLYSSGRYENDYLYNFGTMKR